MPIFYHKYCLSTIFYLQTTNIDKGQFPPSHISAAEESEEEKSCSVFDNAPKRCDSRRREELVEEPQGPWERDHHALVY